MTKYGSFKYGTTEQYGFSTSAGDGEVTWILMVDWNNDGIYDGTNEANRLIDLRVVRGNKHYLSTSGSGFAPMRGGKAYLTLEDYDRRYDPRNSSSPLYPNVGEGKQVYLRVMDNSDHTNYDIMKGVIADIRPISGPGGGDRVRMVINDYMQEIQETECTELASKLMVNLDDAFNIVLDDIGYKGAIDIDADAQPVPSLDIDDKNAGTVVNQLAVAGLGIFFVDRTGCAKYYGRNHSGYTNHSIDEAVCLKQILVSQPWDYVYNHVAITVHRPIWRQPSVIYSLPNPEPINVGTNVTIKVRYTLSKDIELGDRGANTKKDDNGTAIGSAITVVDHSFGQSGGFMELSTSINGYITRLEVHGRMLGDLREYSVHSDATSIEDYGLKKLKIDSPYMQDPHYATVFSEVIKDVTKDGQEGITIEIQQRPAVQFPIDIMHSVALTAATLDLNDTYYITGYEHRWNRDTGQDVLTTIWLHSVIKDNTAITSSEVETENYVPPTLVKPPDDPWEPPDDPPPPGVSSNSNLWVYVDAAALWTFDDPAYSYDQMTYVEKGTGVPHFIKMPAAQRADIFAHFVVPGGISSVAIHPMFNAIADEGNAFRFWLLADQYDFETRAKVTYPPYDRQISNTNTTLENQINTYGAPYVSILTATKPGAFVKIFFSRYMGSAFDTSEQDLGFIGFYIACT